MNIMSITLEELFSLIPGEEHVCIHFDSENSICGKVSTLCANLHNGAMHKEVKTITTNEDVEINIVLR